MAVLRGARAKIARACSQLNTFYKELRPRKRRGPFDVITMQPNMTCLDFEEVPKQLAIQLPRGTVFGAPDMPGRFYVGMLYGFDISARLETTYKPPILDWGIRIGEIVHHLRSALDQLVWELTIKEQAPKGVHPPNPLRGKWKRQQFPVHEPPCKIDPATGECAEWAHLAKTQLWGVDPAIWTEFEALQPALLKRSYKRHWLWLLNELWNGDKHRALHMTVEYGQLSRIKLHPHDKAAMPPAEFKKQFTFHLRRIHESGPLKNGTELVRYLQLRNEPILMQAEIAMEMDAQYAIQPRFHKGPPGYGARVLDTLEMLGAQVEAVLDHFEPFLRRARHSRTP